MGRRLVKRTRSETTSTSSTRATKTQKLSLTTATVEHDATEDPSNNLSSSGQPVDDVTTTVVKDEIITSKKEITPLVKVTHRSHRVRGGTVLTFGQGDTGQLGLGSDIMERMKPAVVSLPNPVIQICAGGMHTVCLLDNGEIYSFGCNDEGALGRDTTEEGSEYTPGPVDLHQHVIQVSAGDSHTAALTAEGAVYAWGCFRSSDGVLGLTLECKEVTPTCIFSKIPVVKVTSGSDHLVMLTSFGSLYTLGCAEQGQLGRVAGYFCSRGGRQGVCRLLRPGLVRKKEMFIDVWCGAYSVYALTDKNTVYAWGLNNYHQLGTKKEGNRFAPERMKAFNMNVGDDIEWLEMDGGLHHTIALDTCGRVYSCGRADYGRLGHGIDNKDVKYTPTQLMTLQQQKMSTISTGGATSYCVSEEGDVFAWGMGSNYQLGTSDEDDLYEPTKIKSKQLEGRSVLMVSGGGQHTVLLVVQSKICTKMETS